MGKKISVDNTQEYICLSLCSGYGGLELGLKRACPNIRTVAYVEVEAFACANLVSKMEKDLLDAAPVWTDIKTFNAEPFRDRIHIVTASYPCQPFSVAGKRQGTDDPRHLWPYIEAILRTVRPVWFFGENVSGHLTLGFPAVYRSLRSMGYAVEAGLFTAAEVGAPHRRQRLFILAYRKCSESGQGIIKETQTGIGRDRFAVGGMADTPGQRIQGPEPEGAAQARRQIDQQGFKWPARPGQPQHEWEEPRVVDDTLQRRHKPTKEQIQTRRDSIEQTDQGQTQPRLGRAVDGTACRVDRLRLLGNGVVPQQAEKAFRYLIEKFEANR